MQRMRTFLSDLVHTGLVVQSVEVPRVIDLDRREDLAAANAWLAAEQA